MTWEVELTSKATKQKKLLPEKIRFILILLQQDIQESGPIMKDWAHFSSINKNYYHCHLKSGRPTYVVAFWRVQ